MSATDSGGTNVVHRDDMTDQNTVVDTGAGPVQTDQKKCFIISPIGHRHSDTRRRADDIRDFVIKPAVNPLGYQVYRADDIAEPGIIIQQIINEIAEADLVIADLTDLNPNVFYELAVRHYTRRPLVTIADRNTGIPFDVNQVRTIFVDHTDLRNVNQCINSIQSQVRAMEKGSVQASNPIVLAQQFQALMESQDPQVQKDLPILQMFNQINTQMGLLTTKVQTLEQTLEASPIGRMIRSPMESARSVTLNKLGDPELIELAFRHLDLLDMLESKGIIDPYRKKHLREDIHNAIRSDDPRLLSFVMDAIESALDDRDRALSKLNDEDSN